MASTLANEIINRIASRFRPRRIVLFGSQVTGAATDQSDVDLMVISDDPVEPRNQALAIRGALHDFPIACDVFVSHPEKFERDRRVVNHLAYFADRYGTVVYERGVR